MRDETNPFERGLSELDALSVTDLLKREGASAAAVQYSGGSGNALQSVWAAAIKKLRGTDLESKKLFRLKGGNQLMTDAFAARLGDSVRLGCPVTRIEHGASGVTVNFREFGKDRKLQADYLVCCVSAVVLRQVPVSPAWPGNEELRPSRDAVLHTHPGGVPVPNEILGNGQSQPELGCLRIHG